MSTPHIHFNRNGSSRLMYSSTETASTVRNHLLIREEIRTTIVPCGFCGCYHLVRDGEKPMSNNEPYLTLELDEHDAKWLAKVMAQRAAENEYQFFRICNMPSSDPQAHMRSLLSMAAMGEKVMAERFSEKMESKPALDETTKTELVKADRVFIMQDDRYEQFKKNTSDE